MRERNRDVKDRFDRERVGIGNSLNERHHSLRMNEVLVVVSRTFVAPTDVFFFISFQTFLFVTLRL